MIHRPEQERLLQPEDERALDPVLLIDPSQTTRATVAWALPGLSVRAAPSVRIGLSMSAGAALVLVALELPGVEALLAEMGPALRRRLVFTCGRDCPPDRLRMARERDIPVLHKPLSPLVLSTTYAAFRDS